jgi:hypothetical protein
MEDTVVMLYELEYRHEYNDDRLLRRAFMTHTEAASAAIELIVNEYEIMQDMDKYGWFDTCAVWGMCCLLARRRVHQLDHGDWLDDYPTWVPFFEGEVEIRPILADLGRYNQDKCAFAISLWAEVA